MTDRTSGEGRTNEWDFDWQGQRASEALSLRKCAEVSNVILNSFYGVVHNFDILKGTWAQYFWYYFIISLPF